MPEMAQRGESLTTSSMRRSSVAVLDDDDHNDQPERDPHVPGSIPPWVHVSSDESDTLIPPPARPNTRHYRPPPSHYKPGRKWDHIRTAEPPLMSAPIADHQTRWIPFMQSGPHPPWHEQGARMMSPQWMEDNVPITVRGWEEEDEALADKPEELKGFWLLSPEKRERTVRLFWVSHNPYIRRLYPKPFSQAPFLGLHASVASKWVRRRVSGGRAYRRNRRDGRPPPFRLSWDRRESGATWHTRIIFAFWLHAIIDLAALAHMGERQTEVHFMSKHSVRYLERLLLKNPFVPLIFRIIVLAFSGASLGLSATLYENIHRVNTDDDTDNQCAPRASTYMAVVVGSVAIPYVLYVTWDEYMSKPLGLRSAVAKTSLLLCDLYFIVFSASNLSLAFDALFDRRWACYKDLYTPVGADRILIPATCPDNPSICYKQKALGGVLIISLVAWLTTFSISVMRVVEKLR